MKEPIPDNGFHFPFKLDQRGTGRKGFAWASRDEKIRQSILTILLTNKNERVMRPEFGSNLRSLMFEPINQSTLTQAKYYIEEALIDWEPRITLVIVEVSTGKMPGGLLFDIRYIINGTNESQSLEVPYSLIE